MSGNVFEVPSASWAQIAALSDRLRSALGLADEPYFPVDHVIEVVLPRHFPDYAFDVGDFELMGGAEGQTSPDGDFIRLREDVYTKLTRGDGRARFTAAHEIGHFFMHTRVVLTRAASATSIPAYRNSEAQANHFAACVLMPGHMVAAADSVSALVSRFGVSESAARNRLRYLQKGRATETGGPPNLSSRV